MMVIRNILNIKVVLKTLWPYFGLSREHVSAQPLQVHAGSLPPQPEVQTEANCPFPLQSLQLLHVGLRQPPNVRVAEASDRLLGYKQVQDPVLSLSPSLWGGKVTEFS